MTLLMIDIYLDYYNDFFDREHVIPQYQDRIIREWEIEKALITAEYLLAKWAKEDG